VVSGGFRAHCGSLKSGPICGSDACRWVWPPSTKHVNSHVGSVRIRLFGSLLRWLFADTLGCLIKLPLNRPLMVNASPLPKGKTGSAHGGFPDSISSLVWFSFKLCNRLRGIGLCSYPWGACSIDSVSQPYMRSNKSPCCECVR